MYYLSHNSQLVSPALSVTGTRGLPQTQSAEDLGKGRLNVYLSGNWYKQKIGFAGAPNTDAQIAMGTGACSFGASDYIDLFGSIALFGVMRPPTGASRTDGLNSVS